MAEVAQEYEVVTGKKLTHFSADLLHQKGSDGKPDRDEVFWGMEISKSLEEQGKQVMDSVFRNAMNRWKFDFAFVKNAENK